MTKHVAAPARQQLGTRAKALSGAAGAAAAAALWSRCMRAAGVSQRRLAASLGRSSGLLSHWSNPARPESPNLATLMQVAALHPPLARELGRALLSLGESTPAPINHATHAMLLAKETGDVCAEIAEALVDGVISREQAQRIDKELADVQERAALARRDLIGRL